MLEGMQDSTSWMLHGWQIALDFWVVEWNSEELEFNSCSHTGPLLDAEVGPPRSNRVEILKEDATLEIVGATSYASQSWTTHNFSDFLKSHKVIGIWPERTKSIYWGEILHWLQRYHETVGKLEGMENNYNLHIQTKEAMGAMCFLFAKAPSKLNKCATCSRLSFGWNPIRDPLEFGRTCSPKMVGREKFKYVYIYIYIQIHIIHTCISKKSTGSWKIHLTTSCNLSNSAGSFCETK